MRRFGIVLALLATLASTAVQPVMSQSFAPQWSGIGDNPSVGTITLLSGAPTICVYATVTSDSDGFGPQGTFYLEAAPGSRSFDYASARLTLNGCRTTSLKPGTYQASVIATDWTAWAAGVFDGATQPLAPSIPTGSLPPSPLSPVRPSTATTPVAAYSAPAAPSPAAHPAPAVVAPSLATTFTDGTYIVGSDIAPGTYGAPGGDSCSWSRLSGFGGTSDDVIDSGGGPSPRVTVAPNDAGFQAYGCGTWTKVIPIYPDGH